MLSLSFYDQCSEKLNSRKLPTQKNKKMEKKEMDIVCCMANLS